MKKITAVHQMAIWLEAEIGQYIPREKTEYIRLIISNAKAMEKEQIMEAHGIKREHDIQNGVDFWTMKSGEQYYNETYGGDK